MRKQILAVLVLTTGLLAPATTAPVRAEPVVPEAVARKMVTSSPQTAGPTGQLSWGLDRIDQRGPVSGSRTYNYANTGFGVNIYVLDSGVNASHPEFGSRVVDGWSYRANSTALNSYKNALQNYQNNPNTGIEPCTDVDPSDPAYPTYAQNPTTFDNPASVVVGDKGKFDNDGHGTHVAGIAAGDKTGVAKEATIIPVRALDSCGNGTTTMIVQGLEWILADHDAGERAVLNLSVGFGSVVSEVDDAITAILNEGVLVVAAAGNDGGSACNSTPASTYGTYSVASSTVSDVESAFSNFGQCIDLFAPGSQIESAYPFLGGVTNTYAIFNGTSMATPFVSGALARYLQLTVSPPTSLLTGFIRGWTWLSSNVTPNAISFVNGSPSSQSPNRLLYVPSAPSQVSQLTATPAPLAAVVSWQGVVPGATYSVSASPGTSTCSVVAGTTCTLTGLVAGTTYTVSVTGSNPDGVGPTAVTTVVAGAPPAAPVSTSVSGTKNSVTLSWPASTTGNVSYVVSSSPATAGCTTTSTSCVVTNLRYGVNYTFSISAVSPTGVVSDKPTVFQVRPGFVVRKSTVAKGSRTSLTGLISPRSSGKKTWAETGTCSISSGRLVAPKRATTCNVVLKVAKSGSYPAMTTTLKVTVK